MVKQFPLLNDFSAGELSPKMLGRSDLPSFHTGCQTLQNFLVLPQGGVTKRPGTIHVSQTRSNVTARLETYVYSPTESYLIEMTNGAIRLYRNGNVVVNSTSPAWNATTMWEVQIATDFRGVYFVHTGFAPVALIRSATDTFSWGAINYIYYGGATYTSHATSNDEGDTTLVVQESIGATIPQQGLLRVKYATGNYDEYTYTSWATSTFSGISPALARDYDGSDTVVVSHEYHSDGTTTPFSGTANYPGAIAIAYGRFWFSGSTRDAQRIWACKSYGDQVVSNSLYLDMRMSSVLVTRREEQTPSSEWADPAEPETQTVTYTHAVISDDSGIQIDIASDMADAIQWMMYGHQLHVGTTAGEWIIPEDITAQNPRALLQTRMGTDPDVFPRFAWDILLFVQSNGTQLRSYKYSAEAAGYKPPDLTLRADHILADNSGAKQLAFQREPRSLLYVTTSGGDLAVLTYESDAGVLAWQEWAPPSASIVSCAVVPESGVDVVYVVYNRGSNFDVEKFASPFPSSQSGIIFMDGCYDVTADADNLLSGNTLTLAWLAARTVTVVVDGAVNTTLAANGSGEIDMTGISGTQIYVGQAYTAKLQTMPISVQSSAGTTQTQKKRVVKVNLRVYNTLQAKVAYNTWTVADAEAYTFGATWETGDIEIIFDGDYDERADVRVLSDEPLPCTILAMVPEVVIPEGGQP